MKTIIRNFIYGIKNLVQWFPVVWADRSWDYAYLLYILRFKLSNMKYAAENDWITEGAEKNANEMGECIEIITRIIDDTHEHNAWDEYIEIWGVKDPFETMTAEERECFSALMDDARTEYSADVSNLMDLLSLFDGWWD